MQTIFQDLRFAVRGLRKTPGSSVLSVFVFGMGIGLCTVMFSILYAVFFRGLDVPEADELLLLRRNNVSRGVQRMGVTQHDFYDWREQQTSFEVLSSLNGTTVNLSDGADPERYRGAFVSANMFDLLEVQPVIGRTFHVEDDVAFLRQERVKHELPEVARPAEMRVLKIARTVHEHDGGPFLEPAARGRVDP